MEIDFEGRKVTFAKELSKLDEMALFFSERLSTAGIEHVFLSGYVSILFGRNRTSEDIDVVCKAVSFDTFAAFWDDIHETLECIITGDIKVGYEYLAQKTALRFAYRGEFIPNVEMKFEYTEMHREAMVKSLDVDLNGRHIPIPSLEQQIAYKLFMNSEKDIEDARFLFRLFEEHLDKDMLCDYLEALEVPMEPTKRYLGWSA